jgi:hypothetical protein
MVHGIPQWLPACVTYLLRLALYPVEGASALVIAAGQAPVHMLCSLECMIPHGCNIVHLYQTEAAVNTCGICFAAYNILR